MWLREEEQSRKPREKEIIQFATGAGTKINKMEETIYKIGEKVNFAYEGQLIKNPKDKNDKGTVFNEKTTYGTIVKFQSFNGEIVYHIFSVKMNVLYEFVPHLCIIEVEQFLD